MRRPEARRRLLLFAGAALAGALAVSCKENLAVLPLLVAMIELLLFAGWRGRLRRHPGAVGAAAAATVGLAALVGAAYWGVIVAEHERYGLPITERLLTQPRVLFHYFSLLVWPLPSRLDVDIDFNASHALLDPPTTLLALVALRALVAAAVALKRRVPLVLFAVAWFVGALVVEQSVLPIDLACEHRLYLASFGPLLVASFALERLASRVALPVWLAAVPVVAALATGTSLRNDEWNDPVRINEEVASRARPGSLALTRSLLSLGSEYLERGAQRREEGEREPGRSGAARHALSIAASTRTAVVRKIQLGCTYSTRMPRSSVKSASLATITAAPARAAHPAMAAPALCSFDPRRATSRANRAPSSAASESRSRISTAAKTLA